MKKLIIVGYFIFAVSNATCREYKITPENRTQRIQEQDQEQDYKNKQEHEKQLQESKIEYLRFCRDLLFSEKKCVLEVWGCYSGEFEECYKSTITGKCHSDDTKDDKIKVNMRVKYFENAYPYATYGAWSNMGICFRLYLKYLLAISCLTTEEQKLCEGIMLGDRRGTILRNGSTLTISSQYWYDKSWFNKSK